MRGDQYLKKSADFDRVYSRGKNLGGPLLILKSLPNGLPYSRWGIVASKKLGSAVARNRIKRRLREVLRQASLIRGNDIVIIARAAAASAGFDDVKDNALKLLKKGGLVRPDEIVSPVAD